MTAKEKITKLKNKWFGLKSDEAVDNKETEIANENLAADVPVDVTVDEVPAEDKKPADDMSMKMDELVAKFDALDKRIAALEAMDAPTMMSKLKDTVEGMVEVQSELADGMEKLSVIPQGPIAGEEKKEDNKKTATDSNEKPKTKTLENLMYRLKNRNN